MTPDAEKVEASYPLAPIQQGMLFHHMSGGAHTGVDVEQIVVTLPDAVDEASLTRAWERVVERHAVLRTRFRWEGRAEPEQEVLARVDVQISMLTTQAEAADDALDELLRADRRRGIALDDAPAWRLTLVHLGDHDRRLVWTYSHAILDVPSAARVLGEVLAIHAVLRDGGGAAIDAARPYEEYVAWLGEEIGAKRERAAGFFRRMLAGTSAPTPLPWGSPDGAPVRGPRLFGEEDLVVRPDVARALGAVARSVGGCLRTCIEAAWAMVLGVHAGEDDVVIGVTRELRPFGSDAEPNVVGVLVNTLPVRVRIPADVTVRAWLADLGAADEAADAFACTPLVDVRAAAGARNGAALFDSAVVYRRAPVDALIRASGRLSPARVQLLEQTSFPLTLFCHAEPALRLSLSYDPARFDSATVRRLLLQLATVLEAMANDPEARVSAIPRLPQEERRQVLVAWNETETPTRADRCVHELIAEQVQRSPDATALVFRDTSITYRELSARASLLASQLSALGVGPDVPVGLFVPRSIEMVIGILGILKAGGAYLPLDPSYPRERLGWMLEDTRAPVVVTHGSVVGALPPHQASLVLLDDAPPSSPSGAPRAHVGPENLAYLIFTSGSSGRPKGVMVQHRNVTNLFAGMDALLGGDGPGVWLALTSISFDISVLEILWTLARGFKVVVQEEADKVAPLPEGPSVGAQRRAVDLSLFYFAADAGHSSADKYRLLLEGARFADEHGFAAVWTPERHFHAFGGLYPNPSVTSAALAAITRRVKIRAGSIVLPLHDPIRVAEEWSVVDNLSGGRVGLSFASGWHADDFALSPANYEDRRDAMIRGIDTVRKLWRGEEVPATSGIGRAISVRIFPAPIQKDPPIWITASGNPETFELAGQMGANVLTNLLGQTLPDLRAKLSRYREARAKAGHAGEGHVTLMLHTFVGDDLDSVRETVRRPFLEYLETSTDLVKKGRWEFPSFRQPGKERAGDAARVAEATDLTREELDALMAHAFERYFETSGLFGTPDTCAAMVEDLGEIGVDEIACLIDFGVAPDIVLAALPHLDRLRRRCAEPRAGDTRWDIPAQIRRHGVTHMQCTPSLAGLLASNDDARDALGQLRRLLVGGEALSEALADQLIGIVPGGVVNVYGPTETTVWSTAAPLGDRTGSAKRVTIGRPIANTQLYVLDAHGAPAPIGAVGELFIGGAGVTRGYLGHPNLTADRFLPNPFAEEAGRPGARVYRTGDRVRWLPDGNVAFLGRVDHQVKIRGHRIELGEVSAALDAHPAILESVAVVREAPSGDAQIVAYAAARGGRGEVDVEQVRAHLLARLPRAMVPGGIVILDALPRTPNGKIDRRALPTADRARDPARRAAPANEVEAKIAGVWKELLNLEDIGVEDNFFDIGANSLLMMQSVGKLATALGKSISLIDMLRFTTVRSLAAHVGTGQTEGQSLEKPVARAEGRRRAIERQRELRQHAR